MQKDRDEDHDAELVPHEKRTRDRDAVEERVQQESDQRRRAGHGADGVGLLPEMKVRRDGVLREVHGQIADQHQGGRDVAAARQRSG